LRDSPNTTNEQTNAHTAAPANAQVVQSQLHGDNLAVPRGLFDSCEDVFQRRLLAAREQGVIGPTLNDFFLQEQLKVPWFRFSHTISVPARMTVWAPSAVFPTPSERT